jgi:dihydrofolate synthase / folylpolyglutamate synthase
LSDYTCIHIAGTNGKGSVGNYITNILMAAGKSVGLFTSPHLLKWQERIQIDGYNIDLPDEFENKLFENGYFVSTAKIAQKYFDENEIDYAVVETGIGGRRDITMEFEADISVVTTIAKDHMDVLGNKLSDIAYQKAGIIRETKPVYAMFQKPVVKHVLNEHAYEKRTQIDYLKKSSVKNICINKDNQTFDLVYQKKRYENIMVKNIASVQVYNAALAMIVCINQGVNIKHIRAGISKKISGRCEIINDNLILDVAHNTSSFETLALMLKRTYPKRAINFMVALRDKKQVDKIAKIINKLAYTVFLVDMDTANFYQPKDISNKFKRPHYLSGTDAKIQNSYTYAISKTKDIDGVLVVAGSFNLTGKIYSLINEA